MRRVGHGLMIATCVVAATSLCAVLGLLVVHLATHGLSSLSVAFFTTMPTGDVAAPGGMAHALVGTTLLLAMASAVGIPLGLLCGVYLSEYADDGALPSMVRFTCDVLAGVPSIVVGVLGYELVVVPLGRYNGFAGAFALAFILVPIVARTTEEMLRLVPRSLREAAWALGAGRASTLFRVVLPTAWGGVWTGAMLALARIAGETAPLLFTALGSRFLTLDPREPFPSLTVQVFTYATGPYAAQQGLAWAGILVLVVALTALNLGVRASR